MKVALISYHTFFQPGGVKRHVLGLQKELKKKGILCKIIAPRRKRTENYGKDVILLGTSFPLPFSGGRSDFALSFNPLAVDKVLKKEKFDVLHFHNFGLSAVQLLERSEALNILTFHASLEGNEFLKRFPIILKMMEKVAQWKIDGIIGVAPFNLGCFKKYSGPKVVIPNGIDLEKFNPNVPRLEKFRDGKINILFLGRIEERKGLIYLLRAFKILEKKFKNIRLIVVGEGPLKSDCQKWARKNRLRNVLFEGRVNEEKIPSYYKSCDIFCSPAIFGESFGLVLTEAMACQKPVVAFANAGYKTVLTGKGSQFLAPPRNFRVLAQKLEMLIENEELRREMGKWGLKESQKYAWPKVAGRILDFYEFCRKEKMKKRKPNFSFDKSLKKILEGVERFFLPSDEY
jgi:phosphatidylinositol alpha-mannosyltransferase